MCLDVLFFVFPYWDSLSFLDLWADTVHKILKILVTGSSNISFVPILSFLLFLDSSGICIYCLIFSPPHYSEATFCFLNFFALYVSVLLFF